MSSKNSRHQSVVHRHSDESFSEDHWLKQFEDKLQKTSVQPRGQSLFDQISSIMNTKSKYPSVQVAVDDMMERSGLKTYLNNVKNSEVEEMSAATKTAQQQLPPAQNDPKVPRVIQEKPSIQQTLENIVKDTRGNIPVPAVISRLHALHSKDIADEGAWEDERLIRLVSQLNLQAKVDNPSSYDNFDNLGQGDHSAAEADLDPSNTDAFNVLQPARI